VEKGAGNTDLFPEEKWLSWPPSPPIALAANRWRRVGDEANRKASSTPIGKISELNFCWLTAAQQLPIRIRRLIPSPSPQLFLAEKLRRREPEILIFFPWKNRCHGPLHTHTSRSHCFRSGMRRIEKRLRRPKQILHRNEAVFTNKIDTFVPSR
jgi:hypothetical protein